MSQSSILAMLHGRASLRPHDVAYTFTDYQHDWDGVRETLTWSQVSRRTLNVARDLGPHGSVGDRAVILAPQGLDYIAAFLGSMQAGLIAVPLPLPHRGSSDARVSAVLADTSPSVVLTTSDVAEDVAEYVDRARMDDVPKIVEIDSMNLDVEGEANVPTDDLPTVAYLQYSSGSTRTPTGVMISHRNLEANFEQLMRSFFVDFGTKFPTEATIVSWLPFYHDMGLVLGVCAPILSGHRAGGSTNATGLVRSARKPPRIGAHTPSTRPMS
jgi:fatty acid CoA ligase FadD21